MSNSPRKSAAELSRELAAVYGLPCREPQLDGAAGSLRSLLPPEFFHWYQCPIHKTWMQPELRPFHHWRCAATVKEAHPTIPSDSPGQRCSYRRNAKMRTSIERRIFATAEFLEEQGE